MQLTRRDALVALGGAGVTAGAVGIGAGLLGSDEGGNGGDETDAASTADRPLTAHRVETAVAAAGVFYPSEVTGIEPFVETYLEGLAAARPEHAASVGAAADRLDEFCERWWSRPFVDLSTERRERAPSEMGLAIADARPDGTDTERVRYFLVDELLYALYASPTGGHLLGIENPPGHPGGLSSYQRGPDSA